MFCPRGPKLRRTLFGSSRLRRWTRFDLWHRVPLWFSYFLPSSEKPSSSTDEVCGDAIFLKKLKSHKKICCSKKTGYFLEKSMEAEILFLLRVLTAPEYTNWEFFDQLSFCKLLNWISCWITCKLNWISSCKDWYFYLNKCIQKVSLVYTV